MKRFILGSLLFLAPVLAKADLRPPATITTFNVVAGTVTNFNATTITVSTLTVTNFVGSTITAAAFPGNVGQVIISSVPFASAVPKAAGASSISTVTLTAGCWEITWGYGVKSTNAGTSITEVVASISTTANTTANQSTQLAQNSSGEIYYSNVTSATIPGLNGTISAMGQPTFVCLAASTPYYLVGSVAFTVSTISHFGGIYAVRIR